MKYVSSQTHNHAVVAKMATKFATTLNSYVEETAEQRMRKIAEIFERETLKLLYEYLGGLRKQYHANFKNIEPQTGWPPLSNSWRNTKHKASRNAMEFKNRRDAHGVAERNRRKAWDEKTPFFKRAYPFKAKMFNDFFHGLGHYGVHDKSRALRTEFSGIRNAINRDKLYRFIGEASLSVSGRLRTLKGFKQLPKTRTRDGHTVKVETLINTKTKKRAPQYKALQAHQFTADGVLVTVSRELGAYAYVKGKRKPLLEVNKQGLVGSKLTLVAFSNFLVGNAVHPSMTNGGFYTRMMQDPANELFSQSGGQKLHFSATKGRDPIVWGLHAALTTQLPDRLEAALKKSKLSRLR